MRKNNRYLIGLLIILIAIAITGCGSSSTSRNTNNNSSQTTKGEVLDGYPTDVMPLYKNSQITACSFSVNKENNHILGKNYYMLSYKSAGTTEEILNYYKPLFTEIDPSYNNAEFINGKVAGRKASVMLSKLDNNIIFVSVCIAAKAEEYVSENKFFADYPQGFMEIVEPNNLIEQTFDKQYPTYSDKTTIRYVKKYTTTMTKDKIIAFYQNKYKDKEGFAVTTNQNYTTVFWKAESYECQITITEGYDSKFKFVQTEIRKFQ